MIVRLDTIWRSSRNGFCNSEIAASIRARSASRSSRCASRCVNGDADSPATSFVGGLANFGLGLEQQRQCGVVPGRQQTRAGVRQELVARVGDVEVAHGELS